MSESPRRGSVVAAVGLVGIGAFFGMFFCGLAGGVIATELSKSATHLASDSAFGNGLLVGGFVGAIVGGLLAHTWWRRRQRPPQPRALTTEQARDAFATVLTMRNGATLANVAGLIGYFAMRGRSLDWSFWFAGLFTLGSIGFLVGSRCPACTRVLDTASVRDRKCKQCETSFA